MAICETNLCVSVDPGAWQELGIKNYELRMHARRFANLQLIIQLLCPSIEWNNMNGFVFDAKGI